ncbi:MAG TPA: hypothetical protein PKE06_26575 [Flavilitoribacter sp.]|nr:hypothetical protein [Flavilitoribacter sp.]HMQ88728.1 hypothetical protein [Flavilitoribacter sp.]
MKDLTLTVTIDEANQILDALGDKPFAQVFRLIQKIQEQATAQLQEPVSMPEVQQVKPNEEGVSLNPNEMGSKPK